MRWTALLVLLAAPAGCASPEEQMARSGLDHGRRYAWTKPGADDVARQRAMFLCSDENQAALRNAHLVNAIPFFGIAMLPATVTTMQGIAERRVRCMEEDGWTLVDVVTSQPQQIARNDWGDLRVAPRSPTP